MPKIEDMLTRRQYLDRRTRPMETTQCIIDLLRFPHHQALLHEDATLLQ